MDQFSQMIGNIPSLSADGSLKKLDAEFRKYAGSFNNLQSNVKQSIVSQPTKALELVDPSVNSIAYLAILHTIVLSGPPSAADQPRLLDAILNFIINFDPVQVRFVGHWLQSLLERIAAGNLFSPLVAVELLVTAILKIDPSGLVFTTTHLSTIRLAYDTESFEPVLRLIGLDILEFPRHMGSNTRPLCDPDLPASFYITPLTGLTGKLKHDMVMEYDVLCGLVYMARRDWSRASDALERVVTYPVKDKAVSKIMVEAYKKWILVAVLSTGNLPKLSSHTNSAAKSNYNTLAEPYTQLATMFVRNEISQLVADVEANLELWAEDANEGLVRELLSAYQKWQIINLRDVYRQISITQIREATLSAPSGKPLPNNQAVVTLLRDMIASGMLKGEIVPATEAGGESYLKYHDEESFITETLFTSELARVQESIEALSNEYKQVNDHLSASKDYVLHVHREQKRLEKDGADATSGFDAHVEDEDLMTGIMSNA